MINMPLHNSRSTKISTHQQIIKTICCVAFLTIIWAFLIFYKMSASAATAPVNILITTHNGNLNPFQSLLLKQLDVDDLSIIFECDSNQYIYEGQLYLSDNYTYNDRLSMINNLSFIYSAEYDAQLSTEAVSFNDPYYKSQWALNSIDAPEAYEILGTKPGDGTVVAVIDTGIDYTHTDIKDNIWINETESYGTAGVDDDNNGYIDDINGYNFVDNYDNPSNPIDDATDSHGSHVAGIIAMEANNNFCGVGVAYCTKVMALKAGDLEGHFSTSAVLKAAKYAQENGADVINLSLGGNKYTSSISAMGIALESISKDCVIVAAAGNEFTPTSEATNYGYTSTCADTYPAAFQSVIGVMSCDSYGRLSAFSNWDYKNGTDKDYDIIAPGSAIYSLRAGDKMYSLSGTSMATPYVSGVVADLISYYKAHGLSYSSEFIKQQLIRSTTHTVEYNDTSEVMHSFKSLNMYDALANPPSPVLDITQSSFYNSQKDEMLSSSGTFYSDNSIAFDFTLLNQFASAKNITVKLECSNPSTYSYVDFTNQSVNIDSLDFNSSYTSNYDDEGSIRFKLNDNFPSDGGILSFILTITASNNWDSSDTKEYSFVNYCSLDISSFITGSETGISTASPDVTCTPVPYTTTIPDFTQQPVITDSPAVTTSPEVLATPEVSPSPVISDPPDVTEQPETTPTPSATAEPTVIPSNAPSSIPTVTPAPSTVPNGNVISGQTLATPHTSVTNSTNTSDTPWYSNLSVYSTRNILYYGGNYANTAYITLAGIPSGFTINYSSNNTRVLKVSKYGKLTATGTGSATISIVLTNNSTGDQFIYLSKIVVKKASLRFSASKLKLTKGKKGQCRVTVKGIKKTSIRFTSSDADIAQVNLRSGMIKALFKGKAYITVKFGKIKSRLTVTVITNKNAKK